MVRAAHDSSELQGVQIHGEYATEEDERSDGGYSGDERGDGGAGPTAPGRGGVIRNSENPDIMECLAFEDRAPFLVSESFPFCLLVAVSTFANLQVIAVETDYGCTNFSCTAAQRAPFSMFDHLFTIVFIVEIGLTMFDNGVLGYFRGDKLVNKLGLHVFHCFDFLVVFLRILDVWVLSMAGYHTGLKVVSTLRICHLAFFVKKVRLVRAFRELYLIISGFQETMKTVLWVALLQFFFIWVFAIIITITVGKDDPNKFDFRQSGWTKDEYWGSVSRSMFSLFQVMTMDNWSASLAWPLVKQRTWMVVVFITFQCISVLALLNTIIGVVVESTLTSARNNEEREGKEKQRTDAMVMESLRTIFHEADTDGSGDLDWEELQAAKKNHKVRDRMKMLGIPFKDLDLLFQLLDEESTGAIKTDMFFRGCARLRGPAMASDLHHMSVDLDRNIKWATANISAMTEANDILGNLLDHIDTVDIDIVKGQGDEKDPVLIARRGRNRQPKASFLRSQNWADKPMHPLLMKDGEAMSEHGSKSRNSSKASAKRNSILHSSLRASSKADTAPNPEYLQQMLDGDDPPPPPPLPTHLRGLSLEDAPNKKRRKSSKAYGQQKSYVFRND